MTTNMAEKVCMSVFGLLNDVTFHMAKCCAEVSDLSIEKQYNLFAVQPAVSLLFVQ